MELREEGNSLFRKGDLEGAKELYTKALEALGPLGGDARDSLRLICLANRAEVHLRLGQNKHAEEDCTIALADGKPDASLLRKLLFRRAKSRENSLDLNGAVGDYSALTRAEKSLDDPVGKGLAALHRLVGGEQQSPASADALADVMETLLDWLDNCAAVREGREQAVEGKYQAVCTMDRILERSAGRSKAFRAFLDSKGPLIVHRLLHSMEGEWILDAKRGTLRIVDSISRRPQVAAAILALDLNPNGLHHADKERVGRHGPGCTH